MSAYINQYRRDFIKTLESISHRHFIVDVFGDVCAAMACSLEQFCHDVKDREERYQSVIRKYDADELAKFHELLANVVNALDTSRESYLGPILEEIGAANTRNGQFLTPNDVARVMSEINVGSYVHTPGKLITLNDPAVGAGVTMIQGGEALLLKGVPQRDIYIVCGDIDHRACDMTFIELTLLGYSACVMHQNALSMEMLSRPRWTAGFFLHGTQWRLPRQCNQTNGQQQTDGSATSTQTEHTSQPQEPSKNYAAKESTCESDHTTQRLEQAVFSL